MSASHALAAVPRVSVILPVYNGADYLVSAIESVLTQDFRDFELICIDDGSRDESGAIIRDFAQRDARVRDCPNPGNIGLPATLNRGTTLARAPLHSWTSHDNLMRSMMLGRLVAALDAAPDAAVAYAGYTVIDNEGALMRYQAPRPVEDRLLGNPVGAAFLYRSEVPAQLGGYDEDLFGAEDYDFWLRAARRFGFVRVDEDLYLYRRHAASLTDQRTIRIRAMVSELIEREIAFEPDRARRAEVLLHLVFGNHDKFDARMAWRAAEQHAASVLRAAPALTWHAARCLKNQVVAD
ncbi:MAG: glycosyltransferase [Sphingopyxis sp.]|nr:glycosyltransferase [Sphingopyxis sp.]